MAFGTWLIRYVQIIYDENSTTDPKKIVDRKEYQIQKPPEQIVCGIYNEFPVNGATLIYDGTAYLRFANLGQPGSDTLHFQVTDSPRLLIKQASFLNNYARAVFTTALGIFALAPLARMTRAAMLQVLSADFSIGVPFHADGNLHYNILRSYGNVLKLHHYIHRFDQRRSGCKLSGRRRNLHGQGHDVPADSGPELFRFRLARNG